MKDSTIIRLAELGAGCLCLFIHAHYGIDSALLLLSAFLFGVPLEILWEMKRKKEEK